MESFEKMVQPPLKNDYLKLIDTVPIFGNLKTTFREILNKLDRKLAYLCPHLYVYYARNHHEDKSRLRSCNQKVRRNSDGGERA